MMTSEHPMVVNGARLRSTTDAMAWTEEFTKLGHGIDEGLMLAWFANAIEAGRSEGIIEGRAEMWRAEP